MKKGFFLLLILPFLVACQHFSAPKVMEPLTVVTPPPKPDTLFGNVSFFHESPFLDVTCTTIKR